MLIIEVDKEKVKLVVEGNPVRVNAELVTAIKAFHDDVVKNTPSIFQELAYITTIESVKMALDLIDD